MEAPRNAPDMPTIKSSDLTRVAVTLTGTYPTGADVTEYGFQWSQDGFETYKTEQNPRMTDEGTFTWTPTFLTPSTSYLFRSYISNGISTRYSTNLSVKTEATSRATLKDVTIRDGYVTASIVDSGGRKIVDIGFLCAETDNMAELKRGKRHWVEMETGDTFSKSLSSFDPPLEPGKTYYFIAYAEDETDAFGYSPNPQRYDVSVDDMVRFEDDNFGEYVIRHYDTNRDGYISYGEIEGIPLIDVITDNITSVREIRLMPHLRYLSCAGSAIGAGLLTRLDVSGNPELTSLVCDYNKLDSLTVSATPKLDTLSCAGNHLSELLVNDLQSLTWLSCSDNDLDQVDVSYNASLRYLDVSGGRLSMLAIADKTELEELLCRNNHFAWLDISHNAKLKKLDCAGNMLPALNISDNRSLAYLDCRDNPADTLYLFANQKVETLLKPDAMQLFYLIEGLSLDPEVLTIQVDETATLKPVIVPEDAIDKTVAWACSNDNVATVSDKGIVTGLSVDTCTILATCGGKTAFCHVTVNPVPVASIELDQNAPEILLDETLILHATVLPANATDKTVTWSSSDETVATVSETGVVTAVATGTCEITASSGGKTATAHLTVSPIPVAEVLLDHSVNDITVKESFQLEATVLPENATDKTVTWSSSNEAVATVSDGYVSGVSVGECIITAQAGRKSASCKVTVNPIPVSEIILSDTSIELLIGGSQNLTATVLPDDASDKSIVWESSDSRIAKVSNDGVVTAVGVGSCSIHAKSGEITATCSIKTLPIRVTSIEITPAECELVVGDALELTASVLPENATYKTVYWESSDEDVATVSQNGVVTAMGEGYCRILASADGFSAQCEVAVSPLIVEVTSVTLDATSLAMTTGDTYTLTATVVPSDATDPTVSWTSSDKSVATVSGGTVRAVGAGTCNITAKAGAKSATCHVTVADAVVAVTSVTLNESTLTLTEGNTATLSATVLPDNATDKTVTWTSDDTNIASVSSSGLVTALAAGSCNITARAGTQSATCRVTVANAIVEVSSVTLNESELTLTEGNTATLSATVLPDNATDKTVTWTSDDTNVASVSSSGLVTALAAGSCTITARAGTESAVCQVTVTAAGTMIPIDSEHFPDDVFRGYIISNIDKDSDGYLSEKEISNTDYIRVDSWYLGGQIHSLQGIEFFPLINSLSCDDNLLVSLDLSKNTILTSLSCRGNQLAELDLSKNNNLTSIYCGRNLLHELDVSNSVMLMDLWCSENQLESLDVSYNNQLIKLVCYSNKLSTLSLSNNITLDYLDCENNQIGVLDVSNNKALTHIFCQDNKITSLDVSNNLKLRVLRCDGNQLSTLDVSKNNEITHLYCGGNLLSSLDLSSNIALTDLSCYRNNLNTLLINSNTSLKYLECGNNKLSLLDLSHNTALESLSCSFNFLSSLDLANNIKLTYLDCSHNQLASLDLLNNNSLQKLRCDENKITELLTPSLTMTELYCAGNQLTTLDVSLNSSLVELICDDNDLTTLDVSNNTLLNRLQCINTKLSVLDVSNNLALSWLDCFSNPNLTEIWLKTGQTISLFRYDSAIATIKYK